MKKIDVCPSTLRQGFDTYSPQAIKELFDGQVVSPYIEIDFEKESDQQQARDNMNNMSISGAQEKFSAIIDNGKIRLTHDGEQATYILKPAPFNLSLSTRKQIPANEHVTMQIASQIYGIRTAVNGLCFSRSGQPVYITKRFDVTNGMKDCAQEDFAAILQMTEENSDSNFKYHGNYAQIADAIKRFVPAWIPQMEQFFRMVVFNYLFANEDAHMKNFSLVNRKGEYFLAPAYDLINTCIHIQSGSDLGLTDGLSPDIEKSDVYARTGHPCRLDFERFADRIGLPKKRADMVLDMFMQIPQGTYSLIDQSFLNDKMKRTYKRVIEERLVRFIRKSE
ncbi:MAG: HipA domain-containing protein [Prevotella sp.]|nr:HipA domain-containing protein [Prevotella sp.]